jgi:hypothetical protein
MHGKQGTSPESIGREIATGAFLSRSSSRKLVLWGQACTRQLGFQRLL